MKKIIAIVLALTLALSLAACGAKADEKTIKVGATPAPHAAILEVAKEILLEKEIEILISVGDGPYTATAWGCDLTYDYVKINGDYRT